MMSQPQLLSCAAFLGGCGLVKRENGGWMLDGRTIGSDWDLIGAIFTAFAHEQQEPEMGFLPGEGMALYYFACNASTHRAETMLEAACAAAITYSVMKGEM